MKLSGTVDLSDDALAALADALAGPVASRLQSRPPHPEDGWLGVEAAAEYAGCSRNAIQKAARSGALESRQEGTNCKLWFKRAWIDAWRGL